MYHGYISLPSPILYRPCSYTYNKHNIILYLYIYSISVHFLCIPFPVSFTGKYKKKKKMNAFDVVHSSFVLTESPLPPPSPGTVRTESRNGRLWVNVGGKGTVSVFLVTSTANTDRPFSCLIPTLETVCWPVFSSPFANPFHIYGLPSSSRAALLSDYNFPFPIASAPYRLQLK